MPRNEAIFPANQIDDFTVLSPGRLRLLDQRASESINAFEGGLWSPTNKICIGGQGVSLAGISAKLEATIETGPQAVGLILGVGQYPKRTHSDAAKRTVLVPIGDIAQQKIGTQANDIFGFQQRVFKRVRNPYGLQCIQSAAINVPFTVRLDQLRVHNGATIVKARVHMRYTRKPVASELSAAGAPTTFARMIRWPVNSNVGLPPSLVNDFDMYLIPGFQEGHQYFVDDVIIPEPANAGLQRQYRCIVAGISGSVSTGWSTTLAATQVSGGASFRVEPRPSTVLVTASQDKHHYVTLPYAATINDTVISQFKNGLPFSLDIPINRWPIIDTDNWSYGIEIISPGTPLPIFHSIELTLDNIQTMREP